ncbi:MAG: UDP-N-acetylglucosamine 1-carboxyvinyltransferase [Angelakisella sp.]
MPFYLIQGGRPLEGSLPVHGAKNAVLPILAAATLCSDCVLEGCPRLSDVEVALDILRHLGCYAAWQDDSIVTRQAVGGSCRVPSQLMGAMRSSIVFLGATLSRFGCAEFTLPGGCELGSRPIDLHLKALTAMGAVIDEQGGSLFCSTPNGLHGAEILLPFPSVGATENILIAAATAKGQTVLRGGAREPEITDLITFLRSCGALIETAINGDVTINGVKALGGCHHRIIPDRIAAGTFLAAAAVTGGQLELTGIRPAHLLSTLAILSNAGCTVTAGTDRVRLVAPRRLRELGVIKTGPYPGFATDMQAITMAVATLCEGNTIFVENIFDNRYRHVAQLVRLGAQIVCQGRTAVVTGVTQLHGASLRCTDLRGGAALVVAALAAEGESVLTELQHIERGYQRFDESIRQLGGRIIKG